MPELNEVAAVLKNNYSVNINNIEFFRDGGSVSYIVHTDTDEKKLFLRTVRPNYKNTAMQSLDIHLFLLKNRFSVPEIIATASGSPCVIADDFVYILYEFIDGCEAENTDAEQVGETVGRLHKIMKNYTGSLPVYDKYFFIDRYIDILRKKEYPRADEFKAYGDELWEKTKNLPRGYSHGDMYRGNVHKSASGIYILDFDTSCNAFPFFDAVKFCEETDYFKFEPDAYEKSKRVLEVFLLGYTRHSNVSQAEIDSYFDLIAADHFQLQASIIEIFGLDCVDNKFLDNQLDWLYRWRELCGKNGVMG